MTRMIDPHTLRRLRRLLACTRHADVRLAADLLASSGDEEALDVLRRALEHGNEVVRSAVVQALAHHRSDAVREMLRQAVEREQNAAVRTELVWALQATGQTDLVADMLRRDVDPEVRLQAAVALGRVLPTDEQALIEALRNDGDSRVRAAAAESLGWVGTKASLKALLDALRTAEPEVRAEAAYALGRRGDLDAAQALLTLKQGFGRLIRSRTDRGVVALLDGRLLTRSYGRFFLGALPDCLQTRSLRDVEDFLNGAGGRLHRPVRSVFFGNRMDLI